MSYAQLPYHPCMETPPPAVASLTAPRKLSHPEARAEQRLFWSRKSIPERLAGMMELKQRMQQLRGMNIDESNTDKLADFTPRRVRRR